MSAVNLKDLLDKPYLKFIVVLTAVVHAYSFLAGYRLTADDVSYHWYAMNGIQESWQFIRRAAIEQGRIVHFPDLVTSLIGAYYSDYPLFRVFYVSLYFANFFLFSFYINRAFGLNLFWFFSFILFIFHPLQFFHTSPGAYPFKIAFPIFLILLARLKLLNHRICGSDQSEFKSYPWLILCLGAMLFSEYAFDFALSLVLIDYVARVFLAGKKQPESRFSGNCIRQLLSRWTLHDSVIIVIFLILYLGFRLVFPSSYDGNKLPTDFNLILFLNALAGHIFGGSVVSSFMREAPWVFPAGHSLDLWQYASILVIFTFSIIVFLHVCWSLEGNCMFNNNLLVVFYAGLFSLISAVLVTTPVVITTKYQNQSWCKDFGRCVFLDSSLSYLGFGLFLGTILLFVFYFASRAGFLVRFLFSILISVVAALSALNNIKIESQMSDYVSGWDRAKALSCYSRNELPDISITSIVDPARRISMHPNFNSDKYWSLFIEDQRNNQVSGHCNKIYNSLFKDFNSDIKYYFNDSGNAKILLAGGWSAPEMWGVWSDGDQANLLIPVKPDYASIELEVSAFINDTHPFQQVDLYYGDIFIESLQLKKAAGNVIVLNYDILYSDTSKNMPFALLSFKFKNQISPLALGINADSRRLALGLVSVTIHKR